jgi:hypothetical protein
MPRVKCGVTARARCKENSRAEALNTLVSYLGSVVQLTPHPTGI